MDVIANWVVPIVVAAITGAFAYLGVLKTVKASNNQMLMNLKAEQERYAERQEHFAERTEMQFKEIKGDIVRLEQKQDKHNSIIERTYKLEQKVEDIEKRFE